MMNNQSIDFSMSDDAKNGDQSRIELSKRFWDAQFKHMCFYNCEYCIVCRQAINAARRASTIDDLEKHLPKTETCEVVVTYSTPYWWNPLYGRFTFMIVSDKGHQEFFKVCKLNIKGLFKFN